MLAHVYGQLDDAIALSDSRLTNDEARRISKLIARLPELVELERDRNKAILLLVPDCVPSLPRDTNSKKGISAHTRGYGEM